MTWSRNVSNNVTCLQLHLQSRTQKVGELLEDYVGELHMLVEKAYPNWTTEQQEVLVRNQFIQGLSSSSSQLLLIKDSGGSGETGKEAAVSGRGICAE